MRRRFAATLMLVFLAFFMAEYGRTPETAVDAPAMAGVPIVLPAGLVPSLDNSEPEPVPLPDPSQFPKPEPIPEPEPEIGPVNPLTGLPTETEQRNSRPVAVVFNNLKRAQPQLGVSQADILWEVPAEGGITRMVGLYQSLEGVGTLGSIRSARSYVLEIVLAYDALLVHAGGSPEAYRDIPAWGVDNMDGVRGRSDAQIFWRDAGRRASMGYEHSLLTSGENIQSYLSRGRYRTEHAEGYQLPLWFAADSAPLNGQSAVRVEVHFSDYKTGVFDYDAETGTYRASQYGGPYKDGNTGEQVRAVNLLVLETEVVQIPGDEAGRLRIAMTGSGGGTYFCGGQCVPIRWSREDRSSPFVFTREDGTPLSFAPGNSYICLVNTGSSLKIQPDGAS